MCLVGPPVGDSFPPNAAGPLSRDYSLPFPSHWVDAALQL